MSIKVSEKIALLREQAAALAKRADIEKKIEFGKPASAEAVATTEQRLGARLPDELRELYETCDGFVVASSKQGRDFCKARFYALETLSIGADEDADNWDEDTEVQPPDRYSVIQFGERNDNNFGYGVLYDANDPSKYYQLHRDNVDACSRLSSRFDLSAVLEEIAAEFASKLAE